MNTVATQIDDKLAWLRQRQSQISAAPRSVIERISSPVIAPASQFVQPSPPSPPSPAVGAAVDVPALPQIHATKETSFAALAQLGLLGIKTSADDVFLIIAAACKGGAADVTGREIQALYERRFERRIESGTISARVNELITAGRVFRRPQSRECGVTRKVAFPVYVVMKQIRMTW